MYGCRNIMFSSKYLVYLRTVVDSIPLYLHRVYFTAPYFLVLCLSQLYTAVSQINK